MTKTVMRIEQPKVVKRKRVAAYCRVSTDHEAQLDRLRKPDGDIQIPSCAAWGLGSGEHLCGRRPERNITKR